MLRLNANPKQCKGSRNSSKAAAEQQASTYLVLHKKKSSHRGSPLCSWNLIQDRWRQAINKAWE